MLRIIKTRKTRVLVIPSFFIFRLYKICRHRSKKSRGLQMFLFNVAVFRQRSRIRDKMMNLRIALSFRFFRSTFIVFQRRAKKINKFNHYNCIFRTSRSVIINPFMWLSLKSITEYVILSKSAAVNGCNYRFLAAVNTS